MTTFTAEVSLVFRNEVDSNIICSDLTLNTAEGETSWKSLTHYDYEAIHGLGRVVRLLPDKLATAIQVNRERMPDPEDDGRFCIDLVEKLALSYEHNYKVRQDPTLTRDTDTNYARKVILQQGYEPWPESFPTFGRRTRSGEVLREPCARRVNVTRSENFEESTRKLVELLRTAKTMLAEYDEAGYKATAIQLLFLARDIRWISEIFLHVAHPIFIDTKRRDYFSEEIARMKVNEALGKMRALPDLHAEFFKILSAP